ncbi:MAG: LamG-like jellyroll fold domain-containing protein [Myxococcota bacterium]
MTRTALWGCAVLAQLGCSTDPLTEIVVVVDSDLAAGDEINEVRIEVEGLGPERQEARAAIGSDVDLPVVTGLVYRGGPLGPIAVTASGVMGGEEVLSRKAEVSFRSEESLLLRLDLVRSCLPTACPAGETCGEAGCESVERVALPVWPGSPPRLPRDDAGLDAAVPDAMIADTSIDRPLDAPADSRLDADASDANPVDADASDAVGDGDAGDAAVGRVTADLVVLYEFDEGIGSTVGDTSGVGTPLDLAIVDPPNVTWGAGTLTIGTATRIESGGPASKVTTACIASDEITVEAWILTSDLMQDGPARIVTNSASTVLRNFTLGQRPDRWIFRLRSTVSSLNALPELLTASGTASAAVTHLVYTRTSLGAGTLYGDGMVVGLQARDGDFSTWDATYGLALGNEFGSTSRPFLGTYHLVAIYCRALTAPEVLQNFAAGPNP